MPSVDKIYKALNVQTTNQITAQTQPSESLQKLIDLYESYRYQLESFPIFHKLRNFIYCIQTNNDIVRASFELDQAVRKYESEIHIESSRNSFKLKDKAIIRAVQVELGIKKNQPTFEQAINQLSWVAPNLAEEMRSFSDAVAQGVSREELKEDNSYLIQAMKKYKSTLPNAESIESFNKQYRKPIRDLQEALDLRPRRSI